MAGWNLTGGLFKRNKRVQRAAGPVAPATTTPVVREASRAPNDHYTLPRFHTTASDQITGRSSDRFAAMRAKLRHAFTPSQPVADRRMFAGRDDVLKTVISCIEDQRLHVVLYGERGIGKTSLLHMLSQAASQARYIVVYTSCGANSTFEDTFRAAAADIPLLFHSGFAPTTAEAEKGATLADLLPQGALSPRKFGDLCAKLTGTRVLIILDEFDRCESGAFRRDVAELIKNLSDRLGRVQLVLAGVAADLTELVEHIPSIRRNIFALHVPKMKESEILEVVGNGEREAGLVFDPSASALVVSVAQGSPYIANLICHHAGHAALDQNRSSVLPNDISTAVDQAVDEFHGRIAKPEQAHIQRLFAQGHGEALALAARASLSGDGAFSTAGLATASETDAKKAQQIVDLLVAENVVQAVDDDQTDKRFAFIEEGLPTYLWIAWAQRTLKVEPKDARATARS